MSFKIDDNRYFKFDCGSKYAVEALFRLLKTKSISLIHAKEAFRHFLYDKETRSLYHFVAQARYDLNTSRELTFNEALECFSNVPTKPI